MLKNLIVLPDGTELTSGTGQVNNIRSCALTECVNNGEELTIGSACANMVEVTVQTPRGGLALTTGNEVTLYKVDNAGTRHKVGPFTLEKPTRPSANLMKLTGYDRVAKLDKDLTGWLKGLTGWPYDLLTFAGMVCEACGLTLVATDIPNGDYLVTQFAAEVTGRQLMQWIGEICCRFCRANADGEIELAWYTPAEVSIASTGANYYFPNGLSFENYQVAPIEAVQLRLADSEDGMLWPEVEEGANSYIISGNRLLNRVTEDMLPVLQVIQDELAGITYTPCRVSLPANVDIHAGNTVQITDKNGVTITAYVMTKTQKAQRDTLECTGSPRRDSSTAQNNKPVTQIAQEKAAQETAKLNQLELLKRLTKEWVDDGLYLTKDGKIGINATAIAAGVLDAALVTAANIVAGYIKSKDGKTLIDLDNSIVQMESADGSIKIDLLNNAVTVATVSGNGNPGKIQLTSSGIRGYGWDTEAEDYVLTLLLSPGDNMGDAATATSFNSWMADGGIAVAPGKKGAPALFGNTQSDTQIRGSTVRIRGTDRVIIQPGKTLLWSGTCAEGDQIEVPNTEDYDLFAIKLGTSGETYDTTVLGYKTDGVIHGVGGFSGSATESKKLYYVTINYTGDTWTLVDACRHQITSAGSVGASTELAIKEIRGVI